MFAPDTVIDPVTLAFVEDGAALVDVAVVLSKLYCTMFWARAVGASAEQAASAITVRMRCLSIGVYSSVGGHPIATKDEVATLRRVGRPPDRACLPAVGAEN